MMILYQTITTFLVNPIDDNACLKKLYNLEFMIYFNPVTVIFNTYNYFASI